MWHDDNSGRGEQGTGRAEHCEHRRDAIAPDALQTQASGGWVTASLDLTTNKSGPQCGGYE